MWVEGCVVRGGVGCGGGVCFGWGGGYSEKDGRAGGWGLHFFGLQGGITPPPPPPLADV